jgi:hypothetical protein
VTPARTSLDSPWRLTTNRQSSYLHLSAHARYYKVPVRPARMKWLGESPTPQQHVLLRSRPVLIIVCLTTGLLAGSLTTFPGSQHQDQLPYKLVQGSKTAAADEQPEQDPLELSSTWRVPGVKECNVEGDSSICSWCNATFTKQHPLSPQHFQRAYLPGRACSMPTVVLQKLQSGEPLHVHVLGGSMTHGTGCNDGLRSGPACAWPSRLQQRLMQAYPAANITVSNKARPGSHYGAWLAAGDLESLLEGADLVIIDLQVNSQVSSSRNASLRMLQTNTCQRASCVCHLQKCRTP